MEVIGRPVQSDFIGSQPASTVINAEADPTEIPGGRDTVYQHLHAVIFDRKNNGATLVEFVKNLAIEGCLPNDFDLFAALDQKNSVIVGVVDGVHDSQGYVYPLALAWGLQSASDSVLEGIAFSRNFGRLYPHDSVEAVEAMTNVFKQVTSKPRQE